MSALIRTIETDAPTYPTFRNVSYNDAGSRYRPFGQQRDLTLLAFDTANRTIARSSNDGASYTADFCPFVFPGTTSKVEGCHHLPDGELLVFTNKADGDTSVFRSVGWADPSTATFVRTLQLPAGLDFAYGGFSAWQDMVLVSTYGPQTDDAAAQQVEAGEYVKLSSDGGRNFADAFTLTGTTVVGEGAPYGNPNQRVHMHGCAYDRWWDRLWGVFGDAGQGKCGVIYSDDRGATWHKVPRSVSTSAAWQSVVPRALPTGLLIGSDFEANGLRRIGRAGMRQMSDFHAGHIADPSSDAIAILTRESYQAPFRPNAPVLFTSVGVNSPSPGVVTAAFDGGRLLANVFVDPSSSPSNEGLYRTIGPTNTGRFVTMSTATNRHANGTRIVADLLP